jgi:hypothetical protein
MRNSNVLHEVKRESSQSKIKLVPEVKAQTKKVKNVKELNPNSVINQFVDAYKGGKFVAIIGLIMGGIVPLALFAIVHGHIDHAKPLWLQINTYIAAGALVRSGITVYEWYATFLSKIKALATVILIEGAMTFSGILWLSIVTLIMLIVINATYTACSLYRNQYISKAIDI